MASSPDSRPKEAYQEVGRRLERPLSQTKSREQLAEFCDKIRQSPDSEEKVYVFLALAEHGDRAALDDAFATAENLAGNITDERLGDVFLLIGQHYRWDGMVHQAAVAAALVPERNKRLSREKHELMFNVALEAADFSPADARAIVEAMDPKFAGTFRSRCTRILSQRGTFYLTKHRETEIIHGFVPAGAELPEAFHDRIRPGRAFPHRKAVRKSSDRRDQELPVAEFDPTEREEMLSLLLEQLPSASSEQRELLEQGSEQTADRLRVGKHRFLSPGAEVVEVIDGPRQSLGFELFIFDHAEGKTRKNVLVQIKGESGVLQLDRDFKIVTERQGTPELSLLRYVVVSELEKVLTLEDSSKSGERSKRPTGSEVVKRVGHYRELRHGERFHDRQDRLARKEKGEDLVGKNVVRRARHLYPVTYVKQKLSEEASEQPLVHQSADTPDLLRD
jgi:hypothetical protein